ncbi:MAG TPA: 30S ribosomal protein S16 [Longimicrobiales bacterium]
MPVRIRLRRVGRKKQPSYRIVVAEGQSPRGGAYIDNVGFYNPRRDPMELRIDLAKVDLWIARGAEVTPTVQSLIKKVRRGEAGVVAAAPEAAPAAEAAPAKKPARKTTSKKAAAAEAPAKEAEAPAAEAAEAPAAEAEAAAPEAEAPAAEAAPEAEAEPEAAEESKE